MRFHVLGPVEAQLDDGEPVMLPAKPRALLAVLLLGAGRPIRRDRLMAALWPERPPPSAQHVIRTYVSALRQSLALSRRDRLPRLAALGDGYRMEVAPEDLDLLVFDDLAGQARRALADGDAAVAARLLDSALGLWRGEPAEDVTVDGETSAVLAGLAERRLLAEEDRAEAELALGRDAALVARLHHLVAAHPLRERLWGQLMTALYRTGQRAAALAAYGQLRAHLIAELGIEPGPELRQLHQQVLAGDPLPPRDAGPVPNLVPMVPRELPPDASHFTGRAAELNRLDAAIGAAGTDVPATVVITAIHGSAGVGKTALAIHWAHRTADQFSDGQLYASLRGHDPAEPADPLQVLARFLRALGVPPERVPGDLDEASAMYRTALGGKRILIVLDNVASSGQVRPLLPGAPGCAVIATGRDRLPGLAAREGAATVTLAPLRPAEAEELLRKILGPERASAEPSAIARIAAECAFLPLALRIAAERAIARPHQSLATLAAQLTIARNRLDVLAAADDPATSVRTVLSWSYLALSPDTARMFRLLGVHPGPDISVPAAAALADSTLICATRLLEDLVSAHLLDTTATDRYRLHDLLRIYATERADTEEDEAARLSGLRRVLNWYLCTADAADRMLAPTRRHVALDAARSAGEPPTFASYEQALAWCDAEHTNLVAATLAAASHGEDEIAWKLTVALVSFFQVRKPLGDWLKCGQASVMAARRAGDAEGEAWVLNGLATVYHALQSFDDSLDCLQRSLRLRRDTGDRVAEGATLNNIGAVYGDLGRFEEAVGCFQRALEVATGLGDQYGQCIALNNLGELHLKQRHLDQAVECDERALAIARDIGFPPIEGLALIGLGDLCRMLRHLADAKAHYRQALSVWQRAGDRHYEAETHRRLGDVLCDTDEGARAREHYRRALAIFEELADPRAGELRASLPELSWRPGGPVQTTP